MKDLVPINSPAATVPAEDLQLLSPLEDYDAQASRLQIKRFLTFLRKLWWVPLITLLLGLGSAAACIRWTPPTFVSTGRMWETVKLNFREEAMFSEDIQNYLGTQAELLKSLRLQQMTLEVLGTNVVTNGEGKPLRVRIQVTQAPKSTVFDIVASSANQQYTQKYLDTLMQQYLNYKRDIRQQVSGGTKASISEQVQKFEREVKDAQEAYNDFQRTNNLAVLEEEGKVAGGYLARLKTQLSDFALEQSILQATEAAQAASGGTNEGMDLAEVMRGLTPGNTAAASPERQAALKEFQALTLQRERLSKYLKPKHPKMIKLQAQLDGAEKYVELFRNQSREQLAAARNALKLKEQSVRASIKEWEDKVTQANAHIAEAERLKQNVTRAQGIYDRLQALMQNLEVSKTIDQETLAVLEEASVAQRSYQKELTLLALITFGGMVLGLGIVGFLSLRDDRFTSVVEVNEKLGNSTLGQVPEMPSLGGKASLLLEEGRDAFFYAESYRKLRSALTFLAADEAPPKIILITSALPGEGKSTIAANLARALAMGGTRVLLVDGDLRKGTLHDLLGLPCEPGLANLLRQPEARAAFVRTNSRPEFTFLGSGKHMDNAGDFFLGDALDELFARWRKQFDYVLIDTSPVFASNDATTLAPKVDGTCLSCAAVSLAPGKSGRPSTNSLSAKRASSA